MTDVIYRDITGLLTRAQDGEPGTFEGYACVWGVQDSYGTSFRKGCFEDGGLDGEPYAYLWMHRSDEPIGTFTAKEDEHGLWVAGTYDATPDGQRARARAMSGSANGQSVGFIPLMVDPDNETVFTQVRLVEVSQITRRMAAVPGAELTSVRANGTDSSLVVARAALALSATEVHGE